MNRCVMCNGTGKIKTDKSLETTDCMYCSGTGIMTHESDDEQLINLLKNNKKHSILLMKTDEGTLVHFNGTLPSFISLFLSGLDSLIKQTGDKSILLFILNELLSREDENE